MMGSYTFSNPLSSSSPSPSPSPSPTPSFCLSLITDRDRDSIADSDTTSCTTSERSQSLSLSLENISLTAFGGRRRAVIRPDTVYNCGNSRTFEDVENDSDSRFLGGDRGYAYSPDTQAFKANTQRTPSTGWYVHTLQQYSTQLTYMCFCFLFIVFIFFVFHCFTYSFFSRPPLFRVDNFANTPTAL